MVIMPWEVSCDERIRPRTQFENAVGGIANSCVSNQKLLNVPLFTSGNLSCGVLHGPPEV